MATASDKTTFVQINDIELKPSPNFSTDYEYNQSGGYTLSGFLIVTLQGQIIENDINAKIAELSRLQTSLECISLSIGCANKFIENAYGRIRSVSINRTNNQPYNVGYTIVVAIETIDGKPVVEADDAFINKYKISNNLKDFILSYDETISINFEAENLYLFNDEGLTKSEGKASGSISVSCYSREICGKPDYDGVKNAVELVKERLKKLLTLELNNDHLLFEYNKYPRYLTSQNINISETNGVRCSFEIILGPENNKAHYAVAEINEEGSNDIRNQRTNHKISGNIKGLLSSKDIGEEMYANKSTTPRIKNADLALSKILPKTISGNYNTIIENLSGNEGQCIVEIDDGCDDTEKTCYQRLSSSISRSMVDGSINFEGEYGDIGSCQTRGAARIEVSLEETLPAIRHKEFIIPSYRPIVQILGDTPHTVNITVRGNLDSCDPTLVSNIIPCVDQEFEKNRNKYRGFIVTSQNTILSNNSYTRTVSLIGCG